MRIQSKLMELFLRKHQIGEIQEMTEDSKEYNNDLYNTANYFSDRKIAEREAFEASFKRRLKRWIAQNDNVKLDWNNYSQPKYLIVYNFEHNRLINIKYHSYFSFSSICVSSERLAERMLKEFRNDFERLFLNEQ